MTTASVVLKKLACFGPDQPLAWRDVDNANKLCERCQSIDWELALLYLASADENSFYPRIQLYQFHPQLCEVRNAAHEGCHLCSLILTCLITMRYRYSIAVDPLPEGLEKFSDATRVEVNVEGMAATPPVRLTVSINSQTGPSAWRDITLPLTSALPEMLDGSTCTSPASSLAREWLHNCLDQHEICGDGKIPKLPRRVIYIVDETLRLEETDNKHAHYATLSYSIGGAHLFTTTSANLQQRKAGFLIKDLPKTAQDAVWWTKQLGLEYLWLDSLCILQDNLSDWEIELSSMADIYSAATVTLAATCAESATEGCLPSLNKLNMLPCQVIPGIIVLPAYLRATWIFERGFLDSRAWCFQEVQLSARVLRVGGEELAWQCRKCKRLEGNPSEQRAHQIEALIPFFGSRALDAAFEGRPFKLWYGLVTSFGNRNLSFSADRLPALSGMAKRFQTILGATYLAGIWREDVPRGLIWLMANPGRDATYCAPTWSWVSVEGGLLMWSVRYYDVPPEEYVMEILEVWVRVSGHNPYGRVSAGRLTIHGMIAHLPSFLFDDESDIGAVDWRHFDLRWDRGLPGIGSCFLRLHKKICLVLEPVMGRIGTYTRAGLLSIAAKNVGVLDSYDWRYDVVSIL